MGKGWTAILVGFEEDKGKQLARGNPRGTKREEFRS